MEVSDKMRSDFISMVAHELRTPLVAVEAGIELMNAGELGELTPEQKETLELAEKNINVLTNLIDDMLDAMRIEAGKLELMKKSLSIGELIRKAVNEFKPMAIKKKHKLILEIPDSLPLIMGDISLLIKVFNNLLSNAIEYTPTNGRIKISAREDGENIHATISDTGIGIPEGEISRIFGRFHVVDNTPPRNRKRMGLGLAIAKGIVENHGGKIWVESEIGKGSTFHVTLPKMEVKNDR